MEEMEILRAAVSVCPMKEIDLQYAHTSHIHLHGTHSHAHAGNKHAYRLSSNYILS